MNKAQIERIHLVVEEMGEAIQAAMKALRHGYDKRHPSAPPLCTNKWELEDELGNVRAAMIFLCENGDLSKEHIHESANHKLKYMYRRGEYLYHQADTEGK